MKKLDYKDAAMRGMEQLKKGAFLTVKSGEKLNTMAIGWAMVGFVWRLPVLMVAVRDSRYTFGLMESASDFTVSIPTTDVQDAVMFCGTKSGRDVDKFKERGLNVRASLRVDTPVIDTPALHFECRIVYASAMDPKHLLTECHGLYPAKDFHTLYFGEIVECYETGEFPA
ncbi:flavin reductase family protein [Thermodesulfobacteriota bacterium]